MERTVIFSIHNTLILQTSVGHRVQKEPLSLDFWFLRPRIHKHSTDSFTPKYSAYQGSITQITHQLLHTNWTVVILQSKTLIQKLPQVIVCKRIPSHLNFGSPYPDFTCQLPPIHSQEITRFSGNHCSNSLCHQQDNRHSPFTKP